jgi:chromosome partitioning protein
MKLREEIEKISDQIYEVADKVDTYLETPPGILERKKVEIELNDILKELENKNKQIKKEYQTVDSDEKEKELDKVLKRAQNSARVLMQAKKNLKNVNSFKSLIFFNLKGGVAKTTLTYMTATQLAERGKNVLVIDLDPQGNITQFLSSKEYPIQTNGTMDMLEMSQVPKKIINQTKFDGVHAVGSDIELTETETFLQNQKTIRESILKNWISDNREYLNRSYDYILFDLSPSFNFLNINGLIEVDSIVYVANPSHSTIQGIRSFKKQYDKYIDPNIDKKKKFAFLVNRVKETTNISENFLEAIQKVKDLESIRLNVNIHEATAIQKAIEKTKVLKEKDNKRAFNEINTLIDELQKKGML